MESRLRSHVLWSRKAGLNDAKIGDLKRIQARTNAICSVINGDLVGLEKELELHDKEKGIERKDKELQKRLHYVLLRGK